MAKPIIITEKILNEIIQKVAFNLLQESLEDDSTDVSIAEEFKKKHGENALDYSPDKEGAFLLTNGKMAYVYSHSQFPDSYKMQLKGAIRMSQKAGAVSLSKYPTYHQFLVLNNSIKHFMRGRFNLEMCFVDFNDNLYNAVQQLSQKIESYLAIVKENLDSKEFPFEHALTKLIDRLEDTEGCILSVGADMDIMRIIHNNFLDEDDISEIIDNVTIRFNQIKINSLGYLI